MFIGHYNYFPSNYKLFRFGYGCGIGNISWDAIIAVSLIISRLLSRTIYPLLLSSPPPLFSKSRIKHDTTKYLPGNDHVLGDGSDWDLGDARGLEDLHAEHAAPLRDDDDLKGDAFGQCGGVEAVVLGPDYYYWRAAEQALFVCCDCEKSLTLFITISFSPSPLSPLITRFCGVSGKELVGHEGGDEEGGLQRVRGIVGGLHPMLSLRIQSSSESFVSWQVHLFFY
jgi:hypothetical protein